MSRDLIYWVEGEVVIGNWDHIDPLIRNVLCVDVGEDAPPHRYGTFPDNHHWRHIPKKEFPKEFLMHLLLMGIH